MVAPMAEATKDYRRADNIFLAWIKEEMAIVPGKDLEAKAAFAAFMVWIREQEPRFHMSKEDFKIGLEAATGGEVCKKRRSHEPNKGRWVFDGLSFANQEELTDANGKVIRFPGH